MSGRDTLSLGDLTEAVARLEQQLASLTYRHNKLHEEHERLLRRLNPHRPRSPEKLHARVIDLELRVNQVAAITGQRLVEANRRLALIEEAARRRAWVLPVPEPASLVPGAIISAASDEASDDVAKSDTAAEDAADVAIAAERLAEIEAHPERLVSGEELERRLADLTQALPVNDDIANVMGPVLPEGGANRETPPEATEQARNIPENITEVVVSPSTMRLLVEVGGGQPLKVIEDLVIPPGESFTNGYRPAPVEPVNESAKSPPEMASGGPVPAGAAPRIETDHIVPRRVIEDAARAPKAAKRPPQAPMPELEASYTKATLTPPKRKGHAADGFVARRSLINSRAAKARFIAGVEASGDHLRDFTLRPPAMPKPAEVPPQAAGVVPPMKPVHPVSSNPPKPHTPPPSPPPAPAIPKAKGLAPTKGRGLPRGPTAEDEAAEILGQVGKAKTVRDQIKAIARRDGL